MTTVTLPSKTCRSRYGAKSVLHETVANITDAINAQVTEWQPAVEEVYPILYIDAIRLRIRDGAAVRIKACHLAVGVDVDGVKRVLGMWIEATEGARFWTGVLTELRNRGIRDADRAPLCFFRAAVMPMVFRLPRSAAVDGLRLSA